MKLVKTETKESPADIDLSAGGLVHLCFEGEDIALCGRKLSGADTADDAECVVCIQLSEQLDENTWYPEWWPEGWADDQL